MGNELSSDQQVNERQLERIFATQWEGQQTLLLKKMTDVSVVLLNKTKISDLHIFLVITM